VGGRVFEPSKSARELAATRAAFQVPGRQA
jgi:hypothetical protein